MAHTPVYSISDLLWPLTHMVRYCRAYEFFDVVIREKPCEIMEGRYQPAFIAHYMAQWVTFISRIVSSLLPLSYIMQTFFSIVDLYFLAIDLKE
jgi:hypothetical protein